jgi:hypothetical protein
MRANESLPLTSQADAAFLIKFAKLGLNGFKGDRGQLLRTLNIIRAGVLKAKTKGDNEVGAQVVEVEVEAEE